mgnify:CR=1 FL=1
MQRDQTQQGSVTQFTSAARLLALSCHIDVNAARVSFVTHSSCAASRAGIDEDFDSARRRRMAGEETTDDEDDTQV